MRISPEMRKREVAYHFICEEGASEEGGGDEREGGTAIGENCERDVLRSPLGHAVTLYVSGWDTHASK